MYEILDFKDSNLRQFLYIQIFFALNFIKHNDFFSNMLFYFLNEIHMIRSQEKQLKMALSEFIACLRAQSSIIARLFN